MDLNEAIKTRRSVRFFSDKKIDKEILEKIMEAGNYAPSHCNTQGWKFIFIDDPGIRKKIFENGASHVVRDSPYGILVAYNKNLSDNTEYHDWIQGAAASIQNMLLTIHDLGLGGCWICHLPRKGVLRKILGMPRSYSPVAYIALGYPKKTSAVMPRKKEVKDIYSNNKFIWPEEKIPVKIYAKRLARKIYYLTPRFIKKIIFPAIDKFVKKFHN